jgi:hypothetical protein
MQAGETPPFYGLEGAMIVVSRGGERYNLYDPETGRFVFTSAVGARALARCYVGMFGWTAVEDLKARMAEAQDRPEYPDGSGLESLCEILEGNKAGPMGSLMCCEDCMARFLECGEDACLDDSAGGVVFLGRAADAWFLELVPGAYKGEEDAREC